MKEIALQEYNFSIIPDVDIHSFVKEVFDWYEFTVLDKDVTPTLWRDILYNCNIAQESFLNYLYDLQVYEYTKIKEPAFFHPLNFPVDVPDDFLDNHDVGLQEFRSEHQFTHELFLLNDIKRVMNKHHMFYADDNSPWGVTNKISYHNQPIKGVW